MAMSVQTCCALPGSFMLSERGATSLSAQGLRLAYLAETAVGQELNQLMLKGYHVYHDFPAEKFNIDHIVVGPAGIFAIETEARTKKSNPHGKTNAEILHDGKSLQFPSTVVKSRNPEEGAFQDCLPKISRNLAGVTIGIFR